MCPFAGFDMLNILTSQVLVKNIFRNGFEDGT